MPTMDNATHRAIVLESTTGEPLGPYRFKAQLYTHLMADDKCRLPSHAVAQLMAP